MFTEERRILKKESSQKSKERRKQYTRKQVDKKSCREEILTSQKSAALSPCSLRPRMTSSFLFWNSILVLCCCISVTNPVSRLTTTVPTSAVDPKFFVLVGSASRISFLLLREIANVTKDEFHHF
jgi:hypothetical protein